MDKKRIFTTEKKRTQRKKLKFYNLHLCEAKLSVTSVVQMLLRQKSQKPKDMQHREDEDTEKRNLSLTICTSVKRSAL
jgi:hypothetical protein